MRLITTMNLCPFMVCGAYGDGARMRVRKRRLARAVRASAREPRATR